MPRLTLSFRGRVLKAYPLREAQLRIGSDPGCDIHIDSLAVEPQHAQVRWDGEQALIEDLSGERGLLVNSRKATHHALAHGDIVQIGKHHLQFSLDAADMGEEAPVGDRDAAPDDAPGNPLAASRAPMGWLQILNGEKLGRTLRLNQALTRVGKRGEHIAVIARRNGGYYLSHLQGERPTLVGDAPVGDTPRKLDDGDIIKVADVAMQFFTDPE